MDGPHLGVVLPNYGDNFHPGRLTVTARAAEEAGLDSGWMTDHVLAPSQHAGIYGTITEALVTVGFLAGRTERLRLGVSALIVPQREPLLTLKQLVSLDVLSGGRLITAVAAGWMEEEFETLGASFANRGRRLDNWLELAGDLLAEAGRHGPQLAQGQGHRMPDPGLGRPAQGVPGHPGHPQLQSLGPGRGRMAGLLHRIATPG